MRRIYALLFALTLAVPVAAANWTYRGSNEPDTAFDTATWMFQNPDTDPNQNVHKIYFNGFARIARETHYNPNTGVLGSRVQPPLTAMSGVLGFWKDCNDDGYVGHAEQGLLEYRVELLLGDDSICPDRHPLPWQGIYPHNDGTWVRELIWIGPTGVTGGIGAPTQNPTNFYADNTAVWADWGRPGALPTLVCPGGNLGIRSVGALLDGADCVTYYRGVRALNTVDPSGSLVGGWEMEDIDNSNSPANIQNPVYPFLYGTPEPEGHPQEGDFRGTRGGILGRDTDNGNQRARLVTIVDCDSNSVDTSPTVNTPGDINNPDTYPSAYESLNDTFEVATQSGSNRCAASGPSDEGLAYPYIEGHNEATFVGAGRHETDFPHEFSVGSRNVVPGHTCTRNINTGAASFVAGPLGFCPPADGGSAVERDDLVVGPAWRTNAQVNTYVITTREQLKSENPDFGATYFTFYARIGPAALAMGSTATGAVGTYGIEPCGSITPGIRNGWNCDPQAWVDRCNNSSLPTLPGQCYRVGFNYHARDVDCWDNTLVRGLGVRAGLSDFSASGPCAGHPNNEQIDLG